MKHILQTKDYKHFTIGDTHVEGAELVDKALPGDIVSIDNSGSIMLVERVQHPQIVGTLELSSKYKYGFTSRNVPIYLFMPMNEAYPPMLVGCSEHDVSVNRIALVQFDTWIDKLPRAQLVKILGLAGNTETELEALYWRYSPWSAPTKRVAASLVATPIVDAAREVIQWPTINIDPAGCRDIDDVVSILRISDTEARVAISIADVAAVIEQGTPLDKHALSVGQSLYQDGYTPRHMLPALISENTSSLIVGQRRPALTLFFHWKDNCISELRWAETWVTNNGSYTYETATEAPVATLLPQIAHTLRQQPVHDSHDWIEALMVFYNVQAAILIASVDVRAVFRAHMKREIPKCLATAGVGFLAAAAAQYVTQPGYHWGLSQEFYCHASSPLRRYADIVNQRAIKAILNRKDVVDVDDRIIEQLNRLQKAAKAHDRDVAFVQAIARRPHGIVEGVVIDKQHVYVPEWKTTIKFDAGEHESGSAICVKYFCDMRARCWKRRIVCELYQKIEN